MNGVTTDRSGIRCLAVALIATVGASCLARYTLAGPSGTVRLATYRFRMPGAPVADLIVRWPADWSRPVQRSARYGTAKENAVIAEAASVAQYRDRKRGSALNAKWWLTVVTMPADRTRRSTPPGAMDAGEYHRLGCWRVIELAGRRQCVVHLAARWRGPSSAAERGELRTWLKRLIDGVTVRPLVAGADRAGPGGTRTTPVPSRPRPTRGR